MGPNRAAMVVVILLLGCLAMAEVSEAASKKNCGKDLVNRFQPCMKSLIGRNPFVPTAACCNAVKKTNLDCFCKAFTSLKLPGGIEINIKAAFTLPRKCGRNIPVNYKCNDRSGETYTFLTVGPLQETVNVVFEFT
ncbi:hypothetical protein R1sor_015473 [Riccia sorocarpa]|uniref:Bifunctional inhibitor/plant lipid transfer protein/seed storage helical domain-containing protein n=1 Tax=Riccia sorocarpa TaxID=122646 RepID=A0ABD3HII1_9MARC